MRIKDASQLKGLVWAHDGTIYRFKDYIVGEPIYQSGAEGFAFPLLGPRGNVLTYLKCFKNTTQKRIDRTRWLISQSLADRSPTLAAAPRAWVDLRSRSVDQRLSVDFDVVGSLAASVPGENWIDVKGAIADKKLSLSTDLRWKCCNDLIWALATLENSGVTHGDLSPFNIIVNPHSTPRQPALYLIDFDAFVAPSAGADLSPLTTGEGGTWGNRDYAPPDVQARGLALDPTAAPYSDLHARDVLLIELLCFGRPPFDRIDPSKAPIGWAAIDSLLRGALNACACDRLASSHILKYLNQAGLFSIPESQRTPSTGLAAVLPKADYKIPGASARVRPHPSPRQTAPPGPIAARPSPPRSHPTARPRRAKLARNAVVTCTFISLGAVGAFLLDWSALPSGTSSSVEPPASAGEGSVISDPHPYPSDEQPERRGSGSGSSRWHIVQVSPEVDRQILASMTKPIGADFLDQPLEETMEYFSYRLKIPIRIDRYYLQRAGVAPDVPVTLHVSDADGISFERILNKVLAEHDLTCAVLEKILLITSRERGDELLNSSGNPPPGSRDEYFPPEPLRERYDYVSVDIKGMPFDKLIDELSRHNKELYGVPIRLEEYVIDSIVPYDSPVTYMNDHASPMQVLRAVIDLLNASKRSRTYSRVSDNDADIAYADYNGEIVVTSSTRIESLARDGSLSRGRQRSSYRPAVASYEPRTIVYGSERRSVPGPRSRDRFDYERESYGSSYGGDSRARAPDRKSAYDDDVPGTFRKRYPSDWRNGRNKR